MVLLKAQGAIESSSRTTAGTLFGQGATEYLVLLAVVLIVALVSVALLGFFPGMASDAQITQSQMYYKSLQPIAIIETSARTESNNPVYSWFYLKLRNTGAYPIRITGMIGTDGAKATQFWAPASAACGVASSGAQNMSDFLYMGPGEENFIGWTTTTGFSCDREIALRAASTTGYLVGIASQICPNSTTNNGITSISSFGFEYIEYIDGQQITKRQMSAKPLIIRCIAPA